MINEAPRLFEVAPVQLAEDVSAHFKRLVQYCYFENSHKAKNMILEMIFRSSVEIIKF